MDAPAKKLRTFSRKTPASAPEKRRALGTADENTSVPGKSSDWPAMDPATEIKQLRQLCTLLRAELAAQSSKVTSSFLAQLSACGAILALCLSLPCHGYTFCWVSSTVQIYFSALLSRSKVHHYCECGWPDNATSCSGGNARACYPGLWRGH